MSDKKLKIGWFSFTCCEDSTIVMTELLNDHYFDWMKLVEFKHAKVLRSKNDMTDLDVAFVEGAISSDEQLSELNEIRKNSKKLIAIGSCANTGRPSANRNDLPPEILEKYNEIFEKFNYGEKVRKLEDVVKVDGGLSGCPMNPDKFVELMGELLVEFGIVSAPEPTTAAEKPVPAAATEAPEAPETPAPEASVPVKESPDAPNV